MFVLDCTASMQGKIDGIKDVISTFAENVENIETYGVRIRVGLIEFRDRMIGEENRAVTFGDSPFTNNSEEFRTQISHLRASRGGDRYGSSWDAIMLALRHPFAPESKKVIVLITNAPPRVPDKDTRSIEEVTDAIRDEEVHQMFLVIPTTNPECQVYLKLLETTRGIVFDLGSGDDFSEEHFRLTLMSLGNTISDATVSV